MQQIPNWGRHFRFTSIPFEEGPTRYHHTLLPSSKPAYSDYEKFDTLTHCTSLEKLKTILEDDCLKQRSVKGSSIINPECELIPTDKVVRAMYPHPLENTEILFYSPYQRKHLHNKEEKIQRYGNVVFSMNDLSGFEGILRNMGLSIYLVETVHYRYTTATRVLVTPNEFPKLLKYNPNEIGWPLRYDRQTHSFYALQKCSHVKNEKVPNTLEILKEQPAGFFDKKWQKNHSISYMPCPKDKLRDGVSVAKDDWVDGNHRVALVVSASTLQRDDPESQNFFRSGNPDVCDLLKTSLNIPEKCNKSCAEYQEAKEWAKTNLVISREKLFDTSKDINTLLKEIVFHGPYEDRFSEKGIKLQEALYDIIQYYFFP